MSRTGPAARRVYAISPWVRSGFGRTGSSIGHRAAGVSLFAIPVCGAEVRRSVSVTLLYGSANQGLAGM